MNTNQIRTSMLSGLVGIALATGFRAFAQQSPSDHSMKNGMEMMGMDAGAKTLQKIMMDSAKKMMAETKPMAMHTDKAFALLMAEHHMSAVQMADIELKEGKSPQLRAMAKQMKAAQLKEIKELKKLAAKQK